MMKTCIACDEIQRCRRDADREPTISEQNPSRQGDTAAMKLFYSPGSPYARIARIAIREFGLLEETAEVLAANRQPDNPVLDYSMVGRVPTLVDDDLVITKTRHVFDYLMAKHLPPSEPVLRVSDWPERSQEGQILGFLEGIAAWVRENRRDGASVSAALVRVEAERSDRCLTYLEHEARQNRLADFPHFSSIALAAALGLMDFRQLKPGWRTAYPVLAAWYGAKETLDSMRQTAPT